MPPRAASAHPHARGAGTAAVLTGGGGRSLSGPGSAPHVRGAQRTSGGRGDIENDALNALLDVSGGGEEELDREATDEPVQKLAPAVLNLLTIEGRIAGAAASAALSKGEAVSARPPENVVVQGPRAVEAWSRGFCETFKMEQLCAPAGVPVTASKKRKSRASDAPVTGRAGLETPAARAELSTCIYSRVRSDLFLPANDCKALASAWLTDKGFTFSEDDFNGWWNAFAHNHAVKRAVAARSSVVTRIKEAIWTTYGTRPRSAPSLLSGATHATPRSRGPAPGHGRCR